MPQIGLGGRGGGVGNDKKMMEVYIRGWEKEVENVREKKKRRMRSSPELIVHSNLPIIQILCSHLSSLLFK